MNQQPLDTGESMEPTKDFSSPIFPETQPQHEPNQIITPEELLPGQKYHWKNKTIDTIGIVGCLEVIAVDMTAKTFTAKGDLLYSMKDFGIVKLGFGRYDAWNYLVPARKSCIINTGNTSDQCLCTHLSWFRQSHYF